MSLAALLEMSSSTGGPQATYAVYVLSVFIFFHHVHSQAVTSFEPVCISEPSELNELSEAADDKAPLA